MATYRADHKGIGNYLQHSPELRILLHARALLGVSAAVGLMHHRTGAIAASGHVEDDGVNGGIRHDRMQYSVVFDAPGAVPAAFHDDPAVLRNALLAAIAVMEAGR